MCKFVFPAQFKKGESDKTVYTVTFPDLPGAVTEGRGMTEAMAMAVECAGLWLVDELETTGKVPQASDIESLHPDEDAKVYPVLIDLNAYQKKYGSRAVRKNVTLPAWLNTFGETHNVNFSELLTKALETLFEQSNQSNHSRNDD